MGRKSSTGRSAAFVLPPCLFLARLRREFRPGILGDLHHLFTDEVERLEVAVHHADDSEGRDEEGHEDEARHARIEAQPFTRHVARDDPDEHQERSFVTKKVGRNARGRGGARITKKDEDVRVQVRCTHHRVVPGEDAEEPDGNPVGHHVRGLHDRAGAKHGGHHRNGPEELGTVRAAVLRVERGELQIHGCASALLGGTKPGEVGVAKLSISGKAELHEGLCRNDCLVGCDSEIEKLLTGLDAVQRWSSTRNEYGAQVLVITVDDLARAPEVVEALDVRLEQIKEVVQDAVVMEMRFAPEAMPEEWE